MKQRIKLDERQLRQVIKESVRKILKEDREVFCVDIHVPDGDDVCPRKYFNNSDKAYRYAMKSVRGENLTAEIYSAELHQGESVSDWGVDWNWMDALGMLDGQNDLNESADGEEDMSGYIPDPETDAMSEHPLFMQHSHHTSDDGYDYCGDDIYNQEADEYNDDVRRSLSTKKGQMSSDWGDMEPAYRHETGVIRDREASIRNALDALSRRNKSREYTQRTQNRGKRVMGKWLDGRYDADELNDSLPF